MADKSNSIQEHLNKDPKDGQELADINVTQGMVRSTLDQRSANLSTSRESIKSQESNNVELRSALEMASDQPQQQIQSLPPQASQLRPETQEILQKYGVNPNIRESRSNTSNVSKSGTTRTTTDMGGKVTNTTTINNVTNNNITTETNIETPPQITSTPQVVQTQVVQRQDNTSKFKAWLTGIFARRDNEAKIKDREYRKKEWELSRTTDKLMRRMEGVSRKFAEKSNPENIGRTFMSQLKLFATLFVANLLPKVWKPMMNGISTISENFMDLLGKGKGESFIGKLKKDVFGIEPGKDISFTEAMSNMFKNVFSPFFKSVGRLAGEITNPIISYLKEVFSDRARAVKDVVRMYDFGIGDAFNLSKLGSLISDMFSAALGGTKELQNMAVSREEGLAKDRLSEDTKGYVFGTNGKLLTGYDDEGRSSNALDSALNNYLRDKDNTNSQYILKALETIKELNKDKEVTLSEETLKRLGLEDRDLDQLIKDQIAKKGKKIIDKNDRSKDKTTYTFNKNSIPILQDMSGIESFNFNPENLSILESKRMSGLGGDYDRGGFYNSTGEFLSNLGKFLDTSGDSSTGFIRAGLEGAGYVANKMGSELKEYDKDRTKSSLSPTTLYYQNPDNVSNIKSLSDRYRDEMSREGSILSELKNFSVKGLFGGDKYSGSYMSEEIYEKNKKGTSGIKNNNPGNLMDLPYYNHTGKFRVRGFNSLDEGYEALFNQLNRYINGETFGKPIDTLDEIFKRYAPKGHGNNNPDIYAKNVSEWTGIGRNQIIDPNNESMMKNLVAAITRMEHGIDKNSIPGFSLESGWKRFKNKSNKSDRYDYEMSREEFNKEIPKNDVTSTSNQTNTDLPISTYKLRPEPSDMITHAGSYYEVNPPELQTTLIPERTEARRNNTSNNYSPKRIENTEESKSSESASKESKSPVIVAPQTNNNGGNTTVNNTYYMTNIGKTNEALYGKGGE